MASAQIEEAPSPSKLKLIRRFLTASGAQSRIDEGHFLQRFARFDGVVFARAAERGATIFEAAQASAAALKLVYEPHRQAWQDEYEWHVNWEFTEAELEKIVAFLEDPVGVHFLEGRWRMDAYISTNMEELIEEIVTEAEAVVSNLTFPGTDS